jgi:hypothetical protein
MASKFKAKKDFSTFAELLKIKKERDILKEELFSVKKELAHLKKKCEEVRHLLAEATKNVCDCESDDEIVKCKNPRIKKYFSDSESD